MLIISMHIYIILTDQYPKGFSDLVKTMGCNGMNKYVQFCLSMNDSMLGLQTKYGNSYGIYYSHFSSMMMMMMMTMYVCLCIYIAKVANRPHKQLIKMNKEFKKT